MSGEHSFSLEFPRRLIGASKVFVNCRTSSEPMTANMVVMTYRLMQAFVAQKRSVCNTQILFETTNLDVAFERGYENFRSLPCLLMEE